MSNPDKTIIALFTHGGGMRGLIPAHIMTKIEERTGMRMADMVDIFAGPSTGSILNAALTRANPDKPDQPLYRARHLVRFYEREGIKIFPPDDYRNFRCILHDFNNRTLKLSQLNRLFRHGHYDPNNLAIALNALYGDAKLGESLSSLIIPTYNIDSEQLEVAEEKDETGDTPARTVNNFMDQGGHAVWLKNIKQQGPAGAKGCTPEVSLYDAVMASCAAPTYYPCYHFNATFPQNLRKGKITPYQKELSCIDGVIFDNPCISYLGAIRRHVPEDHKLIMIVLGTGYINRSVKKEDWNRYGSLGVVDPVNDLPLINIFFHASESALMESFEEEMGDNLYVFNAVLPNDSDDINIPSTEIDDASPENLKKLNHFAHSIIEEQSDKLDKLCDLLTSHRDAKQSGKPIRISGARRFYSLLGKKNKIRK